MTGISYLLDLVVGGGEGGRFINQELTLQSLGTSSQRILRLETRFLIQGNTQGHPVDHENSGRDHGSTQKKSECPAKNPQSLLLVLRQAPV